MANHDFFIVCIRCIDRYSIQNLIPLKIYSSLSSAKRYVKKRREGKFKWNEWDWFCICRINFDNEPFINKVWISGHGGDWINVKD